jgi:hypothetical protein
MTTPEERCLAHGTDYQDCPACFRAERNALKQRLEEARAALDRMLEVAFMDEETPGERLEVIVDNLRLALARLSPEKP